MGKHYMFQSRRVIRKAEVHAVRTHPPLIGRGQAVHDIPTGKHQARYLSRQSTGIDFPQLIIRNALNPFVFLFRQERVAPMVGNDELRALCIDNIIVAPETSRGVVVDIDTLTGSYLELPKNVVRNSVGLIHEEIVALSVLRILTIFVALEFENGVVSSRDEASALVHVEKSPHPFRAIDNRLGISQRTDFQVRQVLSADRDNGIRLGHRIHEKHLHNRVGLSRGCAALIYECPVTTIRICLVKLLYDLKRHHTYFVRESSLCPCFVFAL